jgi:predicted transcriptional regulator
MDENHCITRRIGIKENAVITEEATLFGENSRDYPQDIIPKHALDVV